MGENTFFKLNSNEQTGTYRLTDLTTQITLCDISVTTSMCYLHTCILHNTKTLLSDLWERILKIYSSSGDYEG